MKRTAIILFFTFIGMIATASAQITIAGQNFSTLIVVPIILMVVFMIIFGIVIAVDRHREKKDGRVLEEEREKENHRYGIMGKIKEKIMEMEEKKEPKKEEKLKEEKKGEAVIERTLADYLDYIRELKKEFKKISTGDAFRQLVDLIRNFFSDYLGIDYKFTFDELEKELREKNKEVVFFSKNLSDMSYNAGDISKKSVARLLGEFEDVVEKIILKEEIAIDTYESRKVIQKTPEIKNIKPKEMEKKEEAKKTEYVNEEKKTKIIGLIREGRMHIKRDINKANDIYEEIYIIYHQLPRDKRKELQEKITEFYNAIRLELKS